MKWLALLCLFSQSSHAATQYSLWSGFARGGGGRAVAMAGATTGLADDYSGTLDNPAGLALTLDPMGFIVASAKIQDSFQSDAANPFNFQTIGVAVPYRGYGLAIGYSTPFFSVSPLGERLELLEYRVSAAKSFFDSRLSVGVGLAPSILKISGEILSAFRLNFGALYRFPYRFFLGASLQPASLFEPDSQDRVFSVPLQLSVGAGYIPNRFFRGGLAVRFIFPENPNTLRFHLPSETVGSAAAIQYHLGLEYEAFSAKIFRGKLNLGTYLEASRSNAPNRFHFTGGIDTTFRFFKLGAGVDLASGYQALALSIGLDLDESLRLLRLYPPEVKAPPGGFFPRPFEQSDDWLPPQIQDNRDESFQTIRPELEDFRKKLP